MHSLIVTLDANFRLKLKERGIEDDPPLGPGYAYMVRMGGTYGYKEHLEKHKADKDVRTFSA